MTSDKRALFATAAMGTRFEIVISGDETTAVRSTGELAIAEIEELHRRLSFFATDSLLSHINRTAHVEPVALDASTFALFVDAVDVWRESDGAFDISRGSGMDAVLLDRERRTIAFARPGVTLDLGGIAKGHAVDRAAAILREYGIESALVHGGTSSVAAIGAPPDSDGWKVGIAPRMQHVVILRDNTLSVSSGAMRDHIVDPATGEFVSGPRVAAVIGLSARLGDAWSTACAVRGHRPATMPREWEVIIEE